MGAVAAKAVVGTFQIRNAYVLPADGSIGPSTPTSDFAPQIGGDILNLAAGDLINTNPNGVGNLIIATKTAVDALTTTKSYFLVCFALSDEKYAGSLFPEVS